MAEQVTKALRRFEADHAWVSEHRESLLQEHENHWIAVKDGRVIATDPDLLALRRALADPAHTCIEFITREPLELAL